MKIFVLSFSIIFSLTCFTQNESDKKIIKLLNQPLTIKQAFELISEHPEFNSELVYLSSDRDSSEFSKKALNKPNDSVFFDDGVIYKVMAHKEFDLYRASYIFFDGTKLNKNKIDSLRGIAVKKLKNGEDFVKVAAKYNMDGNTRGPDLGWFQNGSMVPELEEQVKSAKVGDILQIDVPKLSWYYIVKKTSDNKQESSSTLLKVQSNQ